MSGPYASSLLGTGGGATTGKGIQFSGGVYRAPIVTLGDFLDLYLVHFIMAVVFVVGGIILIVNFGQSVTGTPTTWDDLFYVIGSFAFILNVAFGIGLIIAWINKNAGPLSRQDDSIHWLHALSIFASASAIIWSVLALVLNFGPALIDTSAPTSTTGSYFMVLASAAYFAYLVVRYMFGLAGAEKAAEAKKAEPTLTTDQLMNLTRNVNAVSSAAAQPLFGGRGGSAAFGGIDLGGLQNMSGGGGSMYALPPHMAASAASPAPCASPMMMMPQMMMMQPSPAYCAAPPQDPNAIHIT